MYKIHRIFFGYESKQMPNALTPSEAALSKNPAMALLFLHNFVFVNTTQYVTYISRNLRLPLPADSSKSYN